MYHSLVRDNRIPEQEDIPLVLARITHSDSSKRCEWKNTCRQSALFTHVSYEDPHVIEHELRKGTPMKQVEDILWRNTMHEQLQNRFTVYQTISTCTSCLLENLMHFLSTRKKRELQGLLDLVIQRKAALILYHFLSFPEMGLVTPTPLSIQTPQEFLAWLKQGERVEWKLRE